MSKSELFADIRERVEKVPPLPYKKFPIVLVGEGDQYQVMNDYVDLGLTSRTDIPKLLEALDIAVLELECFRGEGNVDEALARIKELDEKHLS